MSTVEDPIITLDLRGTKIKVYHSTLLTLNSSFFKNILGLDKYTATKPQDDGSYFIDCDVDVFRCMLAYTETGHIPHTYYTPRYLKAICDKFDIKMDIVEKKKINPKEFINKNLTKFIKELLTDEKTMLNEKIILVEFCSIIKNEFTVLTTSGTKSITTLKGLFKNKQITINGTITFKVHLSVFRDIIVPLTYSEHLFYEFFPTLKDISGYILNYKVQRTLAGYCSILLMFEPILQF